MILKEFAKIGKYRLRRLASSVDYYEPEPIDLNQKSCEDNSIESGVKYIVRHKKLSDYQIQQFILYHFLHMDERGVIRNVSEREIADQLGCTIRTVRNNNALFVDIGLIYYSNSDNGVNIKLVGYEDYFAKKGYGYVDFDQSFLDTLKGIENVNALRLEIQQEVRHDDFEIRRKMKKEDKPIQISFSDLKVVLPKYTHYKAMIENIANAGSDTFETELVGSDIYFKLKEEKHSRQQIKENRAKEYEAVITELATKYRAFAELGQQGISDMIQLAFEYNMSNLLPALDELLVREFVIGEDTTISYGARVRTIIRRNLRNILTNKPSDKFAA